ncbi:hypothetical protein [Streptomyces sp. NPDC051219]|uniref:hypothetical protein n=1 Tax=Streptomyces sp. NPDC051219 TaxID=3155283 RepID=UPI00341CE0DA
MAGDSRLYAVWPGEWSSHLFAIDDLDEYARAHGIKHDAERTGLADHVREVLCAESEHEQNPVARTSARHGMIRRRTIALHRRLSRNRGIFLQVALFADSGG